MTDLAWVADENGVALHMPDPTGMTLGVTVTLPPEQVEAICARCAAPLVRRKREAPKAFATRRFCSHACLWADRHERSITFDVEAFWRNVDKTPTCWLWIGPRTTGGYGRTQQVPGRRPAYAHRVAYELTVGAIPDGLVLDHLCRNTACVNPAHLEAVTQAENIRRGTAPYGLRTECRHGHDITDRSNVYTNPRGHRSCRTCQRDRKKAKRT